MDFMCKSQLRVIPKYFVNAFTSLCVVYWELKNVTTMGTTELCSPKLIFAKFWDV